MSDEIENLVYTVLIEWNKGPNTCFVGLTGWKLEDGKYFFFSETASGQTKIRTVNLNNPNLKYLSITPRVKES